MTLPLVIGTIWVLGFLLGLFLVGWMEHSDRFDIDVFDLVFATVLWPVVIPVAAICWSCYHMLRGVYNLGANVGNRRHVKAAQRTLVKAQKELQGFEG